MFQKYFLLVGDVAKLTIEKYDNPKSLDIEEEIKSNSDENMI